MIIINGNFSCPIEDIEFMSQNVKIILPQSIFVQYWWPNTKQWSINKQWSKNYCDLFLHDKLSRKQTSSEMN